MSMNRCVDECQEQGLRMAMHECPNLRPVAECEWLCSSGLTVTCITSGSRASFVIHGMQARLWLCGWDTALCSQSDCSGVHGIAGWKVLAWQKSEAW